jgi:glycyl-tRNA synthetase beta chain
MAELLFEIGVEELPALSIEPALDFMASYMHEALSAARLEFSGIHTLGTPRRLVLMVDAISTRQQELSEEILGPNVTIAFEASGELSKAGLGFIRAKNLPESAVYRQKTDKGEVLAAKLVNPGQETKDLLPPILINLMRAIPFKKRMRWESSGENFARPVRRLLCLYDANYLAVNFADVSSGKVSAGHRFLAPEEFVVTSINQYKNEMAERYVMLDPKDRERMFVKAAQQKLENFDARFNDDPDLMATARNLMEYPFAIVGSFEDKYLAIPKEILICEMKSHQKSFSVLKPNGELLPYFVSTAGTKPFDEAFFAKGNARVLRARFEDGAYYFEEDKKKTLQEHAVNLKNLIFERDLGSYAQKSKRIEKLACALVQCLDLSQEITLLKHAAPLLKADLVTGVVGQFPELQGVMGRIYAELDGEPAVVCDAIETHYWPRFADDQLPRTKLAALLSIADKLDTLVGIIAIDKKPKGNKDPFGLRRAAIGIVRMLISFGFNIDLEKLVSLALANYEHFESRSAVLVVEVSEYIIQRARGILIDDLGKESGAQAVSFADSILAVGSNNLLDAFARAGALFGLRNENPTEFDSLSQAFKRAGNIVKKAQSSGDIINLAELEKLLCEPTEQILLQAVRQTQAIIHQQSLAACDDLKASYIALFAQVALIKKPLDAFFDSVMVMVDDKELRQARLGLLGEIKQVADKIADFTHL